MRGMIKACSLIIFVFAVGPASFQFGGFCFTDMEFLTETELVRRAVFQIDSLGLIGAGESGQAVPTIPYGTPEAFLAANPDCCHVVTTGSHEVPPPSFMDAIEGRIRGVFVGDYKIVYRNPDGSSSVRLVHGEQYISNCGLLYSSSPRILRAYKNSEGEN